MVLADGKTRANPEVMRKAAKVLGVKLPSVRGAKSDQELLGNLRLEVSKRVAKLDVGDHVKCGVCGEVATDDTPYCPFCGDEGTTEEAAAAATGAAIVPAAVGVGIAKTPVPTANVEVATVVLAQDLDALLEKIRELKHAQVSMSYEIGVLCREIRDKQLYKAREYKSFSAFAAKELPFARESALSLIAIVEKHTKEDYDRIGYAKLRVILAVNDDAAKTELLSAAREGATTKQLTERAARASTPPKRLSSGPEKEKGEKITLLGRIGARNQVVRFHDLKTQEVIESVGTFKNVSADVYGELEIADGVFVQIGLRVSDEKELKGLTVRFVRPTADE
jgi:uncharacterized OB-fold protein